MQDCDMIFTGVERQDEHLRNGDLPIKTGSRNSFTFNDQLNYSLLKHMLCQKVSSGIESQEHHFRGKKHNYLPTKHMALTYKNGKNGVQKDQSRIWRSG